MRLRSLRSLLLLLLLVVPGVFCFFFCMYFALQDWAALQKAYVAFERTAARSTDMSTLFVAEAKQNIHRINLFADVVWALLGGVVAAIGIHGLCRDCAGHCYCNSNENPSRLHDAHVHERG